MTTRAIQRKYNFLAKVYDWIYFGYVQKTNAMALQTLSLQGNESILNIGCGTGELERRLLQKQGGLHCLGVDLSGDMLERAREKLSVLANVEFREGDFLKVPIDENSFDAVFSISNLHYFSDPQAVFAKAHRSLKRGGKLILIDWNRNSLKGKIYNRYMKFFDPGFNQVYTIFEATTLLEKCGFSVEKPTRFRVGLLWSLMLLVAKKS